MHFRDDMKNDSIRKNWFFLLFYILTILVVLILSGQARWSIFIILISVITLFSSLVFWQLFILPEIGFSKHAILSKYLILNQLFKIPLVLSVKNGEIDGDYSLLKNKPEIRVLIIDQKSAVLVENSTKKNLLLFHGIQVLKDNPKIIGTFFLGIRNIHLGPDSQNALMPKSIQESITEYQARINFAGLTKTHLTSGEIIFPSISIFYRFDLEDNINNNLGMFLDLVRTNNEKAPPIYSPYQFETFLIDEILNNWRSTCNLKTKEEIFTEFPGKFESKELIIPRVKIQIFIEDIFHNL